MTNLEKTLVNSIINSQEFEQKVSTIVNRELDKRMGNTKAPTVSERGKIGKTQTKKSEHKNTERESKLMTAEKVKTAYVTLANQLKAEFGENDERVKHLRALYVIQTSKKNTWKKSFQINEMRKAFQDGGYSIEAIVAYLNKRVAVNAQ